MRLWLIRRLDHFIVFGLDFVEVLFNLCVVWLACLGLIGKLQSNLELGDALTLGEFECGLAHSERSFRVLWILLQDSLALVNDRVVVFLVNFALGEVISAGNHRVNSLL